MARGKAISIGFGGLSRIIHEFSYILHLVPVDEIMIHAESLRGQRKNRYPLFVIFYVFSVLCVSCVKMHWDSLIKHVISLKVRKLSG